jgi:hypothetical protein
VEIPDEGEAPEGVDRKDGRRCEAAGRPILLFSNAEVYFENMSAGPERGGAFPHQVELRINLISIKPLFFSILLTKIDVNFIP